MTIFLRVAIVNQLVALVKDFLKVITMMMMKRMKIFLAHAMAIHRNLEVNQIFFSAVNVISNVEIVPIGHKHQVPLIIIQ